MDVLTPRQRSYNMSRVKSKDTKPEKTVRSLLHRLGYRFRLHVRSLPGSPDIVLPKYKTVIFVHGCFWHRHPGCACASFPSTRQDFWTKKFTENTSRDARVQDDLRQSGWQVLVIWQCELKNLEEVRTSLVRALSAFGRSVPPKEREARTLAPCEGPVHKNS